MAEFTFQEMTTGSYEQFKDRREAAWVAARAALSAHPAPKEQTP